MITVKVARKKLERRGLKGERVYLQCHDGTWKWREYTPFFLTGTSADKPLLKRAQELAIQRAQEYKEMEQLVSDQQAVA